MRPLILPILILCIFQNTLVEAYKNYEGFKLFHAMPSTDGQLGALKDFSINAENKGTIDFWKSHSKLGMGPHEIFVGPSDEMELQKFLTDNGIAYKIAVADFGEKMHEIGPIVKRENATQFFADLVDFDLAKYHRHDSIVQYLKLLANAHPEFIKFSSLGQTFEGREQAMLKLGYRPLNNGTEKRIFFVDAGIHAREWIAPAVALNLINAFVNDPEFHQLLHRIDVHIVPSLNPDGYEYSWENDRLWRRTRSGPWDGRGVCQSDAPICYGADPNRNFAFHWAESGTSPCPCSQTYPGPAAFSEKESRNLGKYLRANLPRLGGYLSLHSYSDVIMHAWNYAARTYPREVAELESVGHKMAAAILEAGGPEFGVGSAPDLMYEASGSSQDYASSLGIKYSFTIELTKGHGFVFPEEMVGEYAEKVLPGILVLARKVANTD